MNNIELLGQRFEVGEQIGQGGMGTVYRGLDRQTGQPVAVKLLKPEVVRGDPGIVERFEREGEALRKLNHPSIVKVLATFKTEDHPCIVMEYVTGGSLQDLLDAQPRLPVERTVQIALDLADALTRAHRLNIVHRDIKPANVLLAEDGTPRLTDFGVAQMRDAPRMTQTGALVGTLLYLSPEAINGGDVDERADIWAFGVLLYQMLAGHTPFDKGPMGATLQAIMIETVPDLQEVRPDAPVALADLIYRMLEKDPNRRIPSVRLVGAELESILRGTESTLHPVDASRFATPTPVAVDLPSSSRPAKVTPPHNLPAQPTQFVGREEELNELTRLMADPGARLVTLTGPGGMGKTRLSIEVASRLLEANSEDGSDTGSKGTNKGLKPLVQDGVFFIPLAALSSPEFIVATIAESLNFTFYSADDPQVQLFNYLREKAMLLVLDNFEHLIAGANLVADLLRAAPGVRALVTSRERLRLQGETIYDLHGMQFPEYETPAELESYAAVRLFLQSARRVVPDFAVTEDNARFVARICRLVQGLPLGIELAAAWLESLPPEDIVAEIERSLDFLETNLRDVPARQRSIRAVFEYSWDMLADAEKDAFMKLSVFRGGFTRDAAQAVTGASLRDLTALVNKSLVRRSPEGRYEIHELLRQYAAEHLRAAPADSEAAHDQHSAHYLDLARSTGAELLSRNAKKAIETFDAELENIRAAWWWAVDHGHPERIDSAANALADYFEQLSVFKEGYDHMRQTAERLVRQGISADSPTLWRVRLYEGAHAGRLGDYQLNRQLAQQSSEVFRQTNAPKELSFALNNLAYVAMMQGEYADARRYGDEAAAISHSIGDGWRTTMSRANVGYAAFLAGEYDEARDIYQHVVKDSEILGVPLGIGFARNNLGEVMQALGDYDEAKRLYEEAYAIFKEIGNRRGVGFTLNNLGDIAGRMGDNEAARRYFEEGLAIYKDIGDRAGTANALQNIGYVEWTMANFERARQYFEESLAIRQEIGDRKGILNVYLNLGNALGALGQAEEALAYFEQSLQLSREIGDKRGIASSLSHMAQTLWLLGRMEEAKQVVEESVALHRELGDPFELALTLTGLALSLIGQGRYQEARQAGEEALALQRQLDNGWGMAFAKMPLILALWESGEKQRAREYAYDVLPILPTMPGGNGIFGLMVVARALIEDGKAELAAEAYGLASNHPSYQVLSSTKELQRQAAEFVAALKAALPRDVIAAAEARGKSSTLEEMVARIQASR